MSEKDTSTNTALLIRRLVNLKCRNGRSMTEHTSSILGLVNYITAIRMKVNNEIHALLLLDSLPDI